MLPSPSKRPIRYIGKITFTWLQIIVLAFVNAQLKNEIELKVLRNVPNSLGGEAFLPQPSLIVLFHNNKNETNLELNSFHLDIKLIDSRSHIDLSHLLCRGDTISNSCESDISILVKNKSIHVEGLFINKAMKSYQLQYTLKNDIGHIFDTILSNEFDVNVGPAFQIRTVIHPENAYGGTSFGTQPVVAIQDRGFNTVTTINEGSISVKLSSDDNLNLECADITCFDVAIHAGMAHFYGLFINKQGPTYALKFNTNLNLEGPKECKSRLFSVGLGPPSQLIIQKYVEEDSESSKIIAGEAFPVQPEIALADEGGNILFTDSRSKIRVQVYINPSSGTLHPTTSTLVSLDKGVAQFRSLSIDIKGEGYRLLFSLLQIDYQYKLRKTEISVLGEPFNVKTGSLFELKIAQYPSEIWEGNQPFQIQPRLHLVDSGGNIIKDDSSTKINAFIVPSLAQTSQIVIDTTKDPIPIIQSIRFTNEVLEYARYHKFVEGDTISLEILFSQQPIVSCTDMQNETLPFIYLNAVKNSIYARAIMNTSKYIRPSQSQSLSFDYIISKDDEQIEVTYASTDSLVTNNCKIMDALGREISLQLPDTSTLLASSSMDPVRIDNDVAFVEKIRLETPSGEYGVGHYIDFALTFSRKVVVIGVPLLLLSVSGREASYSNGSGTYSIFFRYKVKTGDVVDRLDVKTSEDSKIICPKLNSCIFVGRKDGSSSEIAADLSVHKVELPHDQIVKIDTSPVYVVQVKPHANTTDTIYSFGDDVYIDIEFNKPVMVDKGVSLSLDVGPNIGYAKYDYGSGTDTLVLKYTVREGHFSPHLDYTDSNALVPKLSGWVRRSASNPSQDAILQLPSFGNTLANISNIAIDGLRPFVQNIYLEAQYINRKYVAGDVINIGIEFSSRVTIRGNPPILHVVVDGKDRQAVYTNGDGSSILTFSYTVVVGDACLNCNLGYKYDREKALCLSPDCSQNGVKYSQILKHSLKPLLVADTRVSLFGGSYKTGVPIDTGDKGIEIDTSDAARTKIESISVSHDDGVYGVGEIIDFIIVFSDIVYVHGIEIPTLRINIGFYNHDVPYYSGSGSRSLSFRHMVTTDDSTQKLEWVLKTNTTSAITCVEPNCMIKNENAVNADLNFTGKNPVLALNVSIEFDTQSPFIVRVYTTKRISPYCIDVRDLNSCSYSVGEMIPIFVKFSSPVVISGRGLNLIMKTGEKNGTRVKYNALFSSDTDIAFMYEVDHGHSSLGSALSYRCDDQCSLELSDTTAIKRKSSFPIVNANMTLPYPTSLGISFDDLNPIIIDTNKVPSVVNVTSLSRNERYSPGDSIFILIHFSYPVVIYGVPFLSLNVDDENIAAAYYKQGSGSSTLRFEYVVQMGHRTKALDYLDRNSLEVGWKGSLKGRIIQSSMKPTILANLVLPKPGSSGSLSSNSYLRIDCAIPYIVSIFSPQIPGIYHTNDNITIRVEFSTDVVVEGNPQILLETGSTDQMASYISHFNARTLDFLYKVRLGDKTDDLEYWIDPGLFRSSSHSFDLNGASIKRKSHKPIIDADTHLNPSGLLDGTETVEATEGEATFKDLRISKRGLNYRLRFHAISEGIEEILENSINLNVSSAIEYNIIGNQTDRNIGDRFGHAVALKGHWMAVGAPHKRNFVPEIQILSVHSEAETAESEIQVITSRLNQHEATIAILSFQTKAPKGETITGSFSISIRHTFSTLHISKFIVSSDTTSEYLQALFEANMPFLKNIVVSRTVNSDCNCSNAWKWKITFFDIYDGIPLIEFNINNLLPGGANISEIEVEKYPNLISGFFSLINPFSNVESRNIPFDASSSTMHQILEEDLNIIVQSVYAVNTDSFRDTPALGRRWIITFSHHHGKFGVDVNVPNLKPKTDMLQGSGATVWIHIGWEGRAPLSGNFALSIRESNFTDLIPFDASGKTLKKALESISSIQKVSVSERENIRYETKKYGYRWRITFDAVMYQSKYGWLADPDGESVFGNLPPLIVKNELIGWKANYNVDYQDGFSDFESHARSVGARRGDLGIQSGAVFLYNKNNFQWKHEKSVTASDSTSHDNFGHAISLGSQHLLVGAPTKAVFGTSMQQTLTCFGPANAGLFIIHFPGYSPVSISYNSTIDVIKKAILTEFENISKVNGKLKISFTLIDGWDGFTNGFCECFDNSILITISRNHEEKTNPESVFNRASDRISIDDKKLLHARVEVKPTRSPDDINQRFQGINAGSVYLFRKFETCVSFCTYKWNQTQKLTSLDGFDSPTESAQFGFSVSITTTYDYKQFLFIGSPGYHKATGKIYIFSEKNNKGIFFETLTSSVWNQPTPGDRFGEKIATSEDTIMITSSGFAEKSGAVYVFKYGNSGRNFLASQILTGPMDIIPGDSFGSSIALTGNEAVICAEMKVDKLRKSNGICYVYLRKDAHRSFLLTQTLSPTNLKLNDRFGFSVALSNRRMIVTQLEHFKGTLLPPRPVQILRTFCYVEQCSKFINETFRLKWRLDNTSIVSRPLISSISSHQLKISIEEDLKSGPILVSRPESSDEYGGFSWSITFDVHSSSLQRDFKVPPLQCVTEKKVETRMMCEITIKSDLRKRIRGKAHVFTKNHNGLWEEQCYMHPSLLQRQDLFGTSVAIDNDIAVIGAPNRELLNINSGAVIAYDISFLNFSFDELIYFVTEGEIANVKVSREPTNSMQLIGFRSIKMNSFLLKEKNSIELNSFQFSDIEDIQFKGDFENRGLWVAGIFDYGAKNDYTPVNVEVCIEAGQTSINMSVNTIDDHIYEYPDEYFMIHVWLRGMLTSPTGNLMAKIIIKDDGDGIDTFNSKTNYEKLVGSRIQDEDRFGIAVDIDENAGLIVVGSDSVAGFNQNGEKVDRVGAAYIFNRKFGLWSQTSILTPLNLTISNDEQFGQSVAINMAYGRDDVTVLVGAPGQAKVFVFVLFAGSDDWVEQGTLQPPLDQIDTENYFGGLRTITLHDDIAVIGSPRTEAAFIFRRIIKAELISWKFWTMLRSSEFDYDVYGNGFTIHHVHRQGFGTSLSLNRRVLLIGAPYADYGNRGNISEREKFDTDGVDNKGIGRGKAYVFFAQPHVQLITLESDEVPSAGSFQLKLTNYKGIVNETSDLINHDANAKALKQSVERMSNIGEVEVHYQIQNGKDVTIHGYKIEWRISFLSEVDDELPVFQILWKGGGCEYCQSFKMSSLSQVSPIITSRSIQSQQTFMEEDKIQPKDVASGDLFGYSIALDRNSLIVSSMQSAARARTTWDFETGNLMGWSATGNAFDYQPTYGDNSRHRGAYDGFGDSSSKSLGTQTSSSMKGRFYVGTYELRPADNSDYYKYYNKVPKAGSIQGDEPVGTLTSDPFSIFGSTITFLIGGGCNHLTEFVELIVDGQPTMRSTGKCSERMEPNHWDVSNFRNRTAQIRIVDASSEKWGHINVDNFLFNWPISNGCFKSASKNEEETFCSGSTETPKSGVAYIFERACTDVKDNYIHSCRWEEMSRLVPSDKSSGSIFGHSVSIDEEKGVAIVGSITSRGYDFFDQVQSAHPELNPATFEFTTCDELENDYKTKESFAEKRKNEWHMNNLRKEIKHKNNEKLLSDFRSKTGALYLFLRTKEILGPYGNIEKSAHWSTIEHAKISTPDGLNLDQFGYSASLDGDTAVIGAIGVDSHGKNSGAVYIVGTQWRQISFLQREYVALEGRHHQVLISLFRDVMYSQEETTVGYSTSDLTATGVDKNRFFKCKKQPLIMRQGCGDYEQTIGEVTFGVGDEYAFFPINVVNDLCHENQMEYVHLQLHIPGGGPILGKKYQAYLRIDDDDWIAKSTSINCTSAPK